jgi:hypothetical protein
MNANNKSKPRPLASEARMFRSDIPQVLGGTLGLLLGIAAAFLFAVEIVSRSVEIALF